MRLQDDPRFIQAQGLIHNIASSSSSGTDLKQMAIELARLMVSLARKHSTWRETLQFNQLAAMMDDPVGKYFTTCLMDRLFRTHEAKNKGKILKGLLHTLGFPRYLSPMMKAGLNFVDRLYDFFPSLACYVIERLVKMQVNEVIVSSDGDHLKKHLQRRKKENTRVNLNHLGEAILGEKEASHRLEIYLKDLRDPLVEYVSIKISTLFSQIHLIDYDASLGQLKRALAKLYSQSLLHEYVDAKGEKKSKFVNLDMEEYKDLELTLDLFQQTLSQREFLDVRAGIVLQSYLPDSFNALERLIDFARARRLSGAKPIKIRLVKGANLAMERFEADLKGWPLATYDEKPSVDANFKKMLHYAFEAVKEGIIILGVGSHNLFDVAYALLLRKFHGLQQGVELEMLEGMAPQVRKVVQALSGDMLLYCPCAGDEEFHTALAYLVRRLDENTGPDNFLRHFFHLDSDPQAFEKQSIAFLNSFDLIENLDNTPKRVQNRKKEEEGAPSYPLEEPFKNEPDTDWSLKTNVEWILGHLGKAGAESCRPPRVEIALDVEEPLTTVAIADPSNPSQVAFQTQLATVGVLEKAIESSIAAFGPWSQQALAERLAILHRAGALLRQRRAPLILAMLQGCGKTLQEADCEVSEAVDFVEYYLRQAVQLSNLEGLRLDPRGLVAIIPPWNFPAAIAMGGLVAALVTGHSVIFKPALEAAWVGYLLCEILWLAGVPRQVLQLMPCEEEEVGNRLVADPRVAAIVLTGATATADHFLKQYPKRHLIAETGGKNAMILMASCDRDQAIKDLIQSSFSHSGQKCSSCSLALVQREIYEDPHFWEQLTDATRSLKVGSSWNLGTKVGPLIAKPEGKLLWALTQLDEGESWVLQPKVDEDNPQLWSPGLVKDVKVGSRRHREEFFGPVLGLMPFDELFEAIAIVNQGAYGLTCGLQSLDEQEQTLWKEKILAGNLYINRPITGALVARQPFGGLKASRRGHGFKAGGPNMLLGLWQPSEESRPGPLQLKCPEKLWALLSLVNSSEKEILEQCFRSYSYWYHQLSTPSQVIHIPGQENSLLHRPLQALILRWSMGSSQVDQLQTLAAALLTQESFSVSVETAPSEELVKLLEGRVHWFVESSQALIQRADALDLSSIRWLGSCEDFVWQWAACRGVTLWVDPPLYHGRVELLYYLQEVSLCHDYHRYGHVGLAR